MLRRIVACAGVLVFVVVAVAAGFRGSWLPSVGTWLVVSDEVQPSDVIIVLAGNAPNRLEHGDALFQAGIAPLILISDESVRTHGMDTTWLALHRAGLSAADIPDAALLVLGNPSPESTRDEARRGAQLLADRHLRSAILVTDEFHSRRSSLVFGAEFRRRGLTVRSSPARNPEVLLGTWWEDRRTTVTVIEEYTKLVSYFVQGAFW